METSFQKSPTNTTQHSDGDKQPSEKSVDTTSSSTLPSSLVLLQCSHHDGEVVMMPSMDQQQQEEEEEEGNIPPVNEILIASSSNNSTYREQQQQQQQQQHDGHDYHSFQQNETKVQQEKQPDVISSLHIPTEENHNNIDIDKEGRGVATATTRTIITHDTTNVATVGGNSPPSSHHHHVNTTTTATTATAAITSSSSSTSPVLSAIINSVPTNNNTNVMTIMRNNNNNNNNNSYCDEYDDYDWSPPRHIYALREIIVDEEMKKKNEQEEEGQSLLLYNDDDAVVNIPRSESPPDDDNVHPHPPTTTTTKATMLSTTRRRTRLISSQMVNISGQENVKLGKISKGAVLCTQWKSNEEEEEVERHDNTNNGEEQFNNIVENDLNHHVPRTRPSRQKEDEEEEEVTVCITMNKDKNNNSNSNSNSNMKEEYITVVPYSIAQRRMGCNCRKKVEDPDEITTTKNTTTTKRRPSLLLVNGVHRICRIVQRTLFCQQLRHQQHHHPNNNNNVKKDKKAMRVVEEESYCNECNYFGVNPTISKQTTKENWLKRRRRRKKSRKSLSFRNVGATIYGDEAVIGNTSEPINDILSIDSSLGIYVCESGLTAVKCEEIIDAAECLAQHKGAWSAYTYAKQTLGCKEYDGLAEASEEPVMTACATIRDRLEQVWAADASASSSSSSGSGDDSGENKNKPNTPQAQAAVEKQPAERNVEKPKKELVLDTREPHVVKYDISRMERRKLDMHTDRSVWTFIIALSEGRGQDYAGGGTFFEQLNATVHLQRGQMIIFRGKLRHRGVKIFYGRRYLLVGFLVEQKSGSDCKGRGPAVDS